MIVGTLTRQDSVEIATQRFLSDSVSVTVILEGERRQLLWKGILLISQCSYMPDSTKARILQEKWLHEESNKMIYRNIYIYRVYVYTHTVTWKLYILLVASDKQERYFESPRLKNHCCILVYDIWKRNLK